MTAVICNDTHMSDMTDQAWNWRQLTKNGVDKYRNIEIQVQMSRNPFSIRNSF